MILGQSWPNAPRRTNGEVGMCGFDSFLEDIRKHARHKMDCRIRHNEQAASLGQFAARASPRFSQAEKEALFLEAESEAVDRVFVFLRNAAFPDELVSMHARKD